MEPEQTYGKRLHKAARENFREFWSGHRVWVTIATLISPFVVQGKNHGWSSLLTLRETLESAGLAVGLSICGNYLLALWGGAKSLDAGLREDIAGNTKDLELQAVVIAKMSESPKRSQAEEAKITHVRSLLSEFSEDERGFVKWLLHTGETNRAKLAASKCPGAAVLGAVEKGLKNQLIRDRWDRIGGQYVQFVSVNPSYKEALTDLLFATP